MVDAIPDIYPDDVGVTVPENICPWDFSLPEAEHIQTLVENDRGESLEGSGTDNFVGGYPLPIEMLRMARYYEDASQRKKTLDYTICSYILKGVVQSFMIATKSFDIYKDKPFPKAY